MAFNVIRNASRSATVPLIFHQALAPSRTLPCQGIASSKDIRPMKDRKGHAKLCIWGHRHFALKYLEIITKGFSSFIHVFHLGELISVMFAVFHVISTGEPGSMDVVISMSMSQDRGLLIDANATLLQLFPAPACPAMACIWCIAFRNKMALYRLVLKSTNTSAALTSSRLDLNLPLKSQTFDDLYTFCTQILYSAF